VSRSARDALWQEAYEVAADEWGPQAPRPLRGYDLRDAEKTAEAAAQGWYHGAAGAYRKRRLGGLARMPKPGTLLNLTPNQGYAIGLTCVESNGAIRTDSWTPTDQVPLLWSDDLQALFIMPALDRGPCRNPAPIREDRLARMWAKGRGARCAGMARYPSPPLPFVFPCLQTSYASDKFTHGRLRHYIHHHEPGVRAYCSHDPRRREPAVIMIRGGKLRLTSHGIDG
jgi:hypothetical protein